MRQALVLCGGEARRLRPYSHILPKACMPFLNLPLMSLGRFYLESMGFSDFLLNAYLFPEKLKKAAEFLSKKGQKTELVYEDKPSGGAGILYKLKGRLKKEEIFACLNADSLFLPSSLSCLLNFKESFLKGPAEASFFVSPHFSGPSRRALFCDRENRLKFAGLPEDLPPSLKEGKEPLFPFYFSGLSLFKGSSLKGLQKEDFHLFYDFIHRELRVGKHFELFVDKGAYILQGDSKKDYLRSLQFFLNILWEKDPLTSSHHTQNQLDEKRKWNGMKCQLLHSSHNTQNQLPLKPNLSGKCRVSRHHTQNQLPLKPNEKKHLSAEQLQGWKGLSEELLFRFDPMDKNVGLKNGKKLSQSIPLLAPESVQGLEELELGGWAILGPRVRLLEKTQLENSLIAEGVHWKGPLINEMILHSPCF